MAFNLTPRTTSAEATITLHTDTLAQYLEAVSSMMPKKSTVAMLKAIKIYAEGGNTLLRVTDTTCYADMSLPSGSSKGFMDVAVDYETLADLVNKAPKGIMSIELSRDSLTYKVGYSNCGTTTCIPGKDYPRFGTVVDTKSTGYSLTSFDSAYVYSHVSSVCADDKDYAGISGVLVENDDKACSFTATNRKMLVSTNLGIKPLHQHALPKTVFKVVTAFKQQFKLFLEDKYYLFESNNIRIYGHYLKGLFPDVHKIMPKKFDHEHRVNVGGLRKEVQTLMGTVKPTNDGIYPIMLSYADTELHAVEVPSDYVLDKGGIKMDAARIMKLLGRFDDNSDVTFKSTCILERPTVWEDSKGVSLLCCLR